MWWTRVDARGRWIQVTWKEFWPGEISFYRAVLDPVTGARWVRYLNGGSAITGYTATSNPGDFLSNFSFDGIDVPGKSSSEKQLKLDEVRDSGRSRPEQK